MNKRTFLSTQRVFYKKSIFKKASLLMILIGAVVFVGTSVVAQSYSNRNLYSKISDVSISNLKSIHATMETVIDNINTYSYIFLANSTLQTALTNQTEHTTGVDAALYELIGNIDMLEAIYIYDMESYQYGANKGSGNVLKHYNIQEYPWYEEVVARSGQYFLDYHNDDFYLNQVAPIAICFSREIRSLSTMNSMGYMILTISQQDLEERLQLRENYKDMGFYVFSDDGDILVDTVSEKHQPKLKEIYDQMLLEDKNSTIIPFDGTSYSVSLYHADGLNYMNIMPFDELKQENQLNAWITLLLLVIQVVLIITGGILISNWYARPIRKLMSSMEKIKHGVFQPVQLRSTYYEIQALVDDYNKMILEIQTLLQQTKQIERQKRKADLEVLNMQINPHFLYNTFDSIKSLLLLKRYDDAYQMMTALSKFYKINLSKGDDFIPLEREMDMLKQYLAIQKVRYGDVIAAKYEIEPELLGYRILKLVLQPLVENSIYHAIRGNVDYGIITIRAQKTQDEKIKLEIIDNGRGMTPRTLRKVLSGENVGAGKSFGLMGTMKRLEYSYGEQASYTIESTVDKGTHITIWIPIEVQ